MINPTTRKPFTAADADSILGLANQFLEDWEDTQSDEHPNDRDPGCAKRRREFDAIRPLLVQAPALVELRDAVAALIKAKGRFHTEQNYAALVAAFDRLEKP